LRLLTVNEAKLVFYGGPVAIINTIKNHHEMIPISTPMKEYFICEYGVYMANSQTQYRYNKQPMSFYTAHNELIPKKIVDAVEKAYLKRDFMEIKRQLENIYPNMLKGIEFGNIYEVFAKIVDQTNHYAIDLNTEKYLPHMEAYSPQAINHLYHTGNEAVRAIDRLSPPRFPPKAIPMAVALAVGLISIALIQNLPKWIRELNAEIGKGFGGTPPEPVVAPAPVVAPVVEVAPVVAPVVEVAPVVDPLIAPAPTQLIAYLHNMIPDLIQGIHLLPII